MPIDFPSSPTLGQKYTYNGIVYTFTAQGTWTVAANITQYSDAILNGTPTAPGSIPAADDSTRVANTQFVQAAATKAKTDAIAAANAAIAAIPPTALNTTGTCIVFHMQAPPVGWTKRTDLNDRAMRCVSGAVGAGGTLAFSTVFGKTAVDNHTLDGNELTSHAHGVADPSHAHSVADPTHGHVSSRNAGTASFFSSTPDWGYSIEAGGYLTIGYDGIAASGVGIGIYGAGTGIGIHANGASWGHNHGMDIRVLYVDVIIATKD